MFRFLGFRFWGPGFTVGGKHSLLTGLRHPYFSNSSLHNILAAFTLPLRALPLLKYLFQFSLESTDIVIVKGRIFHIQGRIVYALMDTHIRHILSTTVPHTKYQSIYTAQITSLPHPSPSHLPNLLLQCKSAYIYIYI